MKDNYKGNLKLKRSSRSEYSIVSTRHVSKNFSFTVIDITLVMDFTVFLYVVSVASYV